MGAVRGEIRLGARRRIARAQHRGEQVLFGFVVRADEAHGRQITPSVIVPKSKQRDRDQRPGVIPVSEPER